MIKLKYKNQPQDVETIVKHVLDKKGAWTPITLQIIMDLTGVNKSYASGVFQFLKEDERLESRMTDKGTLNDRKKLEFRPRQNSRLTVNQQKFIDDIIRSSDMSEDHIENTLSVASFFANNNAVNGVFENYLQKTSDLLIMKKSNVDLYAKTLVRYGLAKFVGETGISLVFSDSPQVVVPEKSPEADQKQELALDIDHVPAIRRRGPEPGKSRGPYNKLTKQPDLFDNKEPEDKNTFTPPPVDVPVPPPVDPPTEPPVVLEAEENPSERSVLLAESLLRFGDMLGDFAKFFEEKSGEVITEYKATSGNQESLETLLQEKNEIITNLNLLIDNKNNQLEEGNNVLKHLADDNVKLQQTAARYKKESEKFSNYHNVQKKHNDLLFDVIQGQLQIMTADINTSIVDYSRIPAWEIKPSDTARIQNAVIRAVTSAMDEIVKVNAKGFSKEDE